MALHRQPWCWLAGCMIVTAACALAEVPLPAAESSGSEAQLRFWLDEYAFGPGETDLLREAIQASAGAAAVSGATAARFLTLKGFQQPAKWDVYWTAKAGCLAAFKRKLQPHQLVSCVPGTEGITEKARLFATLEAAYSGSAAAIAPLTFALPRQYFRLARLLQGQAEPNPWVLKEEVHQGKGVRVVPAPALLRTALQQMGGKRQFALAQQLVANQLLVAGRPFYIRAWALVFGSEPVRAYLFDGGVVVFGQQQREAQSQQGGGEGVQAEPDLIVNLWRQDRAAADPWSLHQLWEHLGTAASERVWRQVQLAVAATVAAAIPSMRRTSAGKAAAGYRGSTGFAVFGVDFVLDASLKPWLIEMNALPSLARKVLPGGRGGGTATGTGAPLSPFDEQKQRFVRAMLQILLARRAAYAEQQQQEEGATEAGAGIEEGRLALEAAQREAAAAAANGFVVLTPTVYDCLGCLTVPGNASCAALRGLADELPSLPAEQQQQQQQCQAGRLGRGWAGQLQAALGHVLHRLPRFTWGPAAGHKKTRAALVQLTELDSRMSALSR